MFSRPCFVIRGVEPRPHRAKCTAKMAIQSLWYVIGTIAIIVIMHLKSKWIWKLTPFIYGLGLAVMLALLRFYDKDLANVTGSKTGLSSAPLLFSRQN